MFMLSIGYDYYLSSLENIYIALPLLAYAVSHVNFLFTTIIGFIVLSTKLQALRRLDFACMKNCVWHKNKYALCGYLSFLNALN